MKTFEQIKQEIKRFCDIYNFEFKKLNNKELDLYTLKGNIRIIDKQDNYCLGTFYVSYIIDLTRYLKNDGSFFSYPNKLPCVKLLNHDEYKKNDFHIDKNGCCCLAPDAECFYILEKDYSLVDFTERLVIPFFAALLYKAETDKWPYGDYSHFTMGLFEYYEQKLKVDKEHIIDAMNILVDNKRLERNSICFCGSERKYKKCHLVILEDVHRKVDKFYLKRDFKILETKNN